MQLPCALIATVLVLAIAILLPSASAFTQPDQVVKLITFRDQLIGTGPGWLTAFNTTDLGGQYVTDPNQLLGGPWICPTPPQYSDGKCDPCGKNTSIPNPYWDPEFANELIGDGIVTDIHITGINIEGNLARDVAPLFCQFHYLKELGANTNKFTGPFPEQFCSPDCFNFIQKIDFAYGTLSGSLPACIGKMPWLQEFKMQNNRFNGPIPSSWAESKQLWWLDLGNNNITGGIPATYAKRTGQTPIQIFKFAENQLAGPLYPLSQAALQNVEFAGNKELCGMLPATVRFAHGFNTYQTKLGKPCPGETYPPALPYMPYAYPSV